MHVCQLPEHPAFYEGIYVERELVTSLVEIAKREATEQLTLVTGQIAAKGLNTETVLRVGKPYEEIVDAARELGADLIVIGSHGYSRRWTLAAWQQMWNESSNTRLVRYWS
jgi:nucleotide-binding universal stress UspA family protein